MARAIEATAVFQQSSVYAATRTSTTIRHHIIMIAKRMPAAMLHILGQQYKEVVF